MGSRYFRLHEDAARVGADFAPPRCAYRLCGKISAVVRQESRLAAARARRLCDRHGHPREPEGHARLPGLTNQIKVKTHRMAELFLPCGVIFSAAPKTESQHAAEVHQQNRRGP